jgi:hypothetical protein
VAEIRAGKRFSMMEADMEGIVFVVFWLGCAALHTLYDLKIKPLLEGIGEDGTDIPFR